MTDAQIIEFASRYDYIPPMACRSFRSHHHYEDMVSAARCGMLAAALAWSGPAIEGFAPLATTIARREALRYLNRLSRTVWPGQAHHAENGHETLSLDYTAASTGEQQLALGQQLALLDTLASGAPSPYQQAEQADQINSHLACINALLKRRKTRQTRPSGFRSHPSSLPASPDWRPRCHPGDDQGETDACSVFALASYAECMLQKPVSDADAIALWHAAIGSGGISIASAFAAVMRYGNWLPRGTTISRVTTLEHLTQGPLIAVLRDLDWDRAAPTGELAPAATPNRHACLLVANLDGTLWFENSHGPAWGNDGYATIAATNFWPHCDQLWKVTLPAREAHHE